MLYKHEQTLRYNVLYKYNLLHNAFLCRMSKCLFKIIECHKILVMIYLPKVSSKFFLIEGWT